MGRPERRQPPAGRASCCSPASRWRYGLGRAKPGRPPPKELVYVQPLGGRAVVSLRPQAGRVSPRALPGSDWPYHPDRNVTGGLLRCGGRLYLEGAGRAQRRPADLHAGRLVAPFPGGSGHRRFDRRPRQRGVSRAGRRQAPRLPWRRSAAARRPCRCRSTWPARSELDLVVDFGEGGDELDHADWLAARWLGAIALRPELPQPVGVGHNSGIR